MARYLKLILALIITGTIAAFVLLVVIPERLAKSSYEAAKTLGEDFRKVFQFTPEVHVKNTVVLNQQATVLELAVLSQNFQHQYAYTNTWMGSTKKIDISGTFIAKVGFDLNKKFQINIVDKTATVSLPEPQLLALESQPDITYRDEDGLWNWVSQEDRTTATNAFIKDARAYAARAGFINDARLRAEDQIRSVLAPHVDKVVFQYQVAIPELE
ncbi:MAG: hypothetical protein BroJett042_11750 [Bacteroidota bacterium]|nr:MAG: hypothetical protein UZ12_BCD005003024 [Bacteroidetes bacterium OLB12]GIL22662.1 MAG: hypothetical protein BroJett042_11750 [Bacteroidota bacterium]HNR73303.1 DUF4230 domain-containing protein [Cyclobacteriaceae bacterium]HNU42779.1 DUF4230 domain-containing protein [Cyclobacteriaceae bacterium]